MIFVAEWYRHGRLLDSHRAHKLWDGTGGTPLRTGNRRRYHPVPGLVGFSFSGTGTAGELETARACASGPFPFLFFPFLDFLS